MNTGSAAVGLLLGVLGVLGVALAADGPAPFTNQELLDRKVPQAQYEAIFRGAAAQCRAEATAAAAKTFPAPAVCSMDQNPGAFWQCQKSSEAHAQQRQAVLRDVAVGCVAQKGWLL